MFVMGEDNQLVLKRIIIQCPKSCTSADTTYSSQMLIQAVRAGRTKKSCSSTLWVCLASVQVVLHLCSGLTHFQTQPLECHFHQLLLASLQGSSCSRTPADVLFSCPTPSFPDALDCTVASEMCGYHAISCRIPCTSCI